MQGGRGSAVHVGIDSATGEPAPGAGGVRKMLAAGQRGVAEREPEGDGATLAGGWTKGAGGRRG